MMISYSTTVIVIIYNSDWKSLKSTLLSIILQENIDFEIILADDGSKETHFNKIISFFAENNFKNYKTIFNERNLGTVQNYYNALLQAKGEYVYGISPGDMFYSPNTLSKLYKFAKKENIDVCFGNAVYYNLNDSKINIIKRRYGVPRRPWMYQENVPLDEMKYFFFHDNFILGATFFRRTSTAIKYIGRIRRLSKYVEDNTSTAYLLADGIRVYYYNNYVIWYEFGNGISTSDNSEWGQLLDKDLNNCYFDLCKSYPNDKIINECIRSKQYSRNKKKLYLLMHLPRMFFKKMLIKFTPMKIHNRPFDVTLLKMYLKN